jgi:hypothetical protein
LRTFTEITDDGTQTERDRKLQKLNFKRVVDNSPFYNSTKKSKKSLAF